MLIWRKDMVENRSSEVLMWLFHPIASLSDRQTPPQVHNTMVALLSPYYYYYLSSPRHDYHNHNHNHNNNP
tara:strand:+ start:812 stop:1024 length:213 start_codon:yes stop_codon:yes gene_type:complete